MAYYVTIKSTSGRPRTVWALGPFNRHGDAERCVGWVHRHVVATFPNDTDASWAAYGTAHVKGGPMPVGRFNEAIGLPAGRIVESPLPPNRWWTPGEQPELPRRAPQRRPRRRAA